MQLAELLTTNTEVGNPSALVRATACALSAGCACYGHELSMTDVASLSEPHVAVLEAPPAARRVPGLQEDQGGVRQQGGPLAPTRRVGVIFPWDRALASTRRCSLMASKVGELSSGGYSPCLGHNVAQAYLNLPYTKPGTKLTLDVRGKTVEAEVAKFPFVQTHYYKL